MKKILEWSLLLSFLIIVIYIVAFEPVDSVKEYEGGGPVTIKDTTYPEAPNYIDSVIIGGKTIKVEVAVMLDEMSKGLSDRDSMPQDHGMLFVVDNGSDFVPAPDFWMRNMRFSLDMIWIGRDFKIIYIKKNATPESYPEKFGPGPNVDARYVLEVNAGFSNKNNLKVGDKVELLGQ